MFVVILTSTQLRFLIQIFGLKEANKATIQILNII